MNKLLSLLLLLFWCNPAFAATYYVDYVGGSDAGAGTSTGAAWKHCPGDANFTGTYSADTTNGDTFIFKGAVVYKGMMTFANSGGGTGKEMTYRGNTVAGDWGTGKAKIDLENTRYHAFLGASKNYIKILNFEMYGSKNTNNVTQTVTRGGSDQSITYAGSGSSEDLGVIYSTGNNWTLKDLIIHTSENYSDLCVIGANGAVPAQQVGIYLDTGAHDITVDNVEMYSVGRDGMWIAAYNVTIKNSNIGGISRGAENGYISVALRIDIGSHDITIQDNSFHDLWQYGGDDGAARCHSGDYIHIYGAANPPYNIDIDRNLFYIDHAFTYANNNNYIYPSDGAHDINIRNNVFLNLPSANGSIYMISGFYNINILNNTFVDWGSPKTSLIYLSSGATSGHLNTVTVKNNIFYTLSSSNV
jgi:hypothetical protein